MQFLVMIRVLETVVGPADARWHEDVKDIENGVFVIAEGVLVFFEEFQVRSFLLRLADNFPGADVLLSSQSRSGRRFTNKSLRRTGMTGAATQWVLRDAHEVTKWDKRITVLGQFPLFKNIPRDAALGTHVNRGMDLIDTSGMHNVVHLRV